METYVERREGGYYVAGTRISLDSIIYPFKNGASPEGILRSFPLIGSLEKVYGAITFYLANTEAVEGYLSEQERLSGALEARLRVPFLADANLDQDIVAGVVRRNFELPPGVIPEGMSDPEVVAMAASLGRILVTHDVRTMPGHFGNFISENGCPGLISHSQIYADRSGYRRDAPDLGGFGRRGVDEPLSKSTALSHPKAFTRV